ncbi:MAG: hypothetical protein U0795_06430 [Pirellulales bacterium]
MTFDSHWNHIAMQEHVNRSWEFLKTTAVGGILFLLPLAAIVWLLGHVYRVVGMVYEPLKDHLPLRGVGGTAVIFVAAIAILFLVCFVSGLAGRRAIARKFSQTVEKHLIMVFPKYAIYKDILAGNVGGPDHTPTLVPVTVEFNDSIRLGYQSGRTKTDLVIVYLPGSPDPWTGTVVLVEPWRVRPLPLDFNTTSAICERLGRDSAQLLASVHPPATLGERPGV